MGAYPGERLNLCPELSLKNLKESVEYLQINDIDFKMVRVRQPDLIKF